MLRKDISTHSHIFTPADDSLKARVDALKGVLQASHNIKLSLELSGDRDWQNRLGTTDELQQAQDITQRSLKEPANKSRLLTHSDDQAAFSA